MTAKLCCHRTLGYIIIIIITVIIIVIVAIVIVITTTTTTTTTTHTTTAAATNEAAATTDIIIRAKKALRIASGEPPCCADGKKMTAGRHHVKLTRAPVSRGGFFRHQAPVHVRLVTEHIIAQDAAETVSRDGNFTLLAQT